MWSSDYPLTTDVGSQALWHLLGGVEGLVHWNDGIEPSWTGRWPKARHSG